jgi:hypothetical protein
MSNVRERQLKVVRSLRKANRKLEAKAGVGDLEHDSVRIYPVRGLAYFDMESRTSEAELDSSSPSGLPEHPEWRELSKIRTDLDAFSDIEILALMYQGYQLSDRFVRKYLGNTGLSGFNVNQKPDWPAELFNPKFELRRHGNIIRAGKHRIARIRRMEPLSFYFLLFVPGVLLLLGLVRSGMTFDDLGRKIGAFSYWLLEHPYLVPDLRIPMNTHFAFLLVVLGIPALILFKKFLWVKLRAQLIQRSAKQLINKNGDPVHAFSVMKKILDGFEFAIRFAFLSLWLIPVWIAGAISLIGKLLILEEKVLLRLQNNEKVWLKHHKRKLSPEEQAEVFEQRQLNKGQSQSKSA